MQIVPSLRLELRWEKVKGGWEEEGGFISDLAGNTGQYLGTGTGSDRDNH